MFLVEDEIVTREGIRDNVDWNAAGFEFCGEASDGEMALQLIQETKPDVLITDIKMPFMDGLQLSRLVREHMPWMKVIILSGHDEFNYAQSAVKLGVTEYLLKPISSQELHTVMLRVAKDLDQAYQENQKLKEMQHKLEDSLILSREKFLLDLVMGVYSSTEAIEQSQQLGINIIAQYYMVALVRIELCDPSQPFDYHQYRFVEEIVSEFAGNNLDVMLTKKDFEELVLFIKGDQREQMIAESEFLLGLIVEEIEKQTDCNIKIISGSLQDRLANVHLSFLDAFLKNKVVDTNIDQSHKMEAAELVPIDHEIIEKYLQYGDLQEYDAFFDQVIRPVGDIALQSDLMKQYLFMDLILKVNQFKRSVLGQDEDTSANLSDLELLLEEVDSIEQIKTLTKMILQDAVERRSSQVNQGRGEMFEQITAYLEKNFENPDLSQSLVAGEFNLTPNYFSTLFHQEVGVTFRDFLTNLRIDRAKVLLCTTNIKISEIAFYCGYKDAHYFSYIFKKKVGQTPSQFRRTPQNN